MNVRVIIDRGFIHKGETMKLIKTILMWLSIILILGGLLVIVVQYTSNVNLFHVLMNNSVVQGSLGVIKTILLAALAVLVGFILLIASFKLGSYISRKEEEKRIAELQRQADKAALEARIKQQEEQTAARLKNAEEVVNKEIKNV